MYSFSDIDSNASTTISEDEYLDWLNDVQDEEPKPSMTKRLFNTLTETEYEDEF